MAATIKDLGKVTAYAYAKAAGYTGTEEQFQAIFNEFTENAPGLMDRLDTAVTRAEAAVTEIDATVQNAVDDAVEEATTSAVATANQAVTDAQAAQTAAEGAVTQANAAVTQANNAVTAAQAAQSAAEDAAESFVLDRTLTDSGAAAPADLVGDLQEFFIQQDYEPLFELTVDDAAPTGWKINGTGGSVSASGYTIHKKRVNAGSILKIVANANTVFQFQDNTATVPTGDNSHLIGTPVVGVFNDYVTAPTGAGYLMISYPDSDTSVSVTLIKQSKTILDASFDGALKALDASELNISKGGYNNSGTHNYNNSAIHTSALPLNTVLVETLNNLLTYYFAIWDINGNYVGSVDAEGFHASGTSNTQYFQSFANVTDIMNTYGSGTIRLVIIARDGTNIQDIDYNDYFTVYTNVAGTSLSIESAKKDMFNSAYSSVDLTQKLKEYGTLVANGSAISDSFLFFTDPHYFDAGDELAEGWLNNMQKYMPTIQKAYNSTPTTFCLCGGDWLTNSDTPEAAATKLGYMTGIMNDFFHPYYMVNGNHDTNYQGTEELSTSALINLMFGNYGKMYYSFTTPHSRFYVFDTGKDHETVMTAYRWEQVDWFGKQLLTNTADEHIVIALHIVTNQTKTNFDSNPTFQSMATNIAKIADAYNNKTSITLNDETYNFSSATGTVEFIIAGHTHWDKITTLENIPVLITQEAFAGSTSTFDLVFADYTNRVVKTVRIGEGSNRTMNLKN